MAPEQWEQIKEQFDVVVQLDAEARAQVFAQLQSQDPALCARLKELVANDEQAGDFLTETLIVEEAPRFNAGEIVAGRYRIERFIGRGGMGEVYEAHDNELGERVALKTIVPDAALDERYVARLLREVRLARRISNRHVCRVHDIGHHDAPWGRICFYTMELLEGETLAERLSRCRHMSTEEAFPLIEQLAEALQAAHAENIIHRDFKPGNIMLVDERRSTRVVVTDFGLARSAEAAQTFHTTAEGGSPPGTMGYIAPELFQPGAVATVASDIYSFGMVIRDMIAGHHTASSNSSPPPLEPRWQNAIRRCLENDPARRFTNAEDVVDALRPQTLPGRSIAWTRKHPSLAATAIVLLAALIATPLLMHWVGKPQIITEYRQITDDSGLSESPAISHDGKLLAYASDRDGTGNLNLYLR